MYACIININIQSHITLYPCAIMSTYFLGPDLTLFSYHVIKRVCTYIIIVEMCLGGFEGNEDRVIGGDGG